MYASASDYGEEPKTGIVAAEIVAIVAGEVFEHLATSINVACAPDIPVPTIPVLKKFWMPDDEKLTNVVTQIM